MPRTTYTQASLLALADTSPAETYNIRLVFRRTRKPVNSRAKLPKEANQNFHKLNGKLYAYKLVYNSTIKAHYIDIPLSVYMAKTGPVKVADTATNSIGMKTSNVPVVAFTNAETIEDDKSIAQDITSSEEMKNGQLLVLCYKLT